MPKYLVTIERKVTTWDSFQREVEAPNANRAAILGDEIARNSNHDCPDDCDDEGRHAEFGDFYVEEVNEQ